MRADALVEFWRTGLNPAKQGRMIHVNATMGEHARKIAVADRELQIPADGLQDDLRRELPTFEQILVILLH
jgi:D-ribose pyranose/furanose isomerase RbsD